MKKTLYILMGVAVLSLAACQKTSLKTITPTSGVVDGSEWTTFIQGTNSVNTIRDAAYYESLRQWKKDAFDKNGLATRSISYIFFADYGSMAFRFADIPDSVDVINLWGGTPKFGSLDYLEMKACQNVKGMKVVGCRITRILENQKWGMQAQIPSYMKAYNDYKVDYAGKVASGKMTAQELESAAKNAGNSALRADIAAHTSKNADGSYPEWVVYAAQILLDEIEEYGLDGYDLDYEPEGDPLSGAAFNMFVEYMSQFIGPKSGNEGTLLIVDRNSGSGSYSNLAPYCNFWIYQKYGSTGGASAASESDFPSNTDPTKGWVNAQIITTENVGDTYSNGCGVLEQMAGFQPSLVGQKYGHKGGFASFHGQRDWRLEPEGAEKGKLIRYQHHRKGIQAQADVKYYSE